MKRYSKSYLMSIDPKNDFELKMLDNIKKRIKNENKISSNKKRVVLRGRKPVMKQTQVNPWNGKISTRSYDFGGNIVGGLKNAQRIDVYLYNRYQ